MDHLSEPTSTEALENELREISNRISTDPIRFQQIRDELRRRHEKGGDQPRPMTEEQVKQLQQLQRDSEQQTLINKLISMEAEQARLVIEVEVAKAARREAEERLALVCKTFNEQKQS